MTAQMCKATAEGYLQRALRLIERDEIDGAHACAATASLWLEVAKNRD